MDRENDNKGDYLTLDQKINKALYARRRGSKVFIVR